MEIQTMSCLSDVRDFVVGMDYDSIEEDKGHFTIRRKVTMTELIEELHGFVTAGHTFPTFPASAKPTVTFAWDLADKEDGDCYGEIINELNKINGKELTKQC